MMYARTAYNRPVYAFLPYGRPASRQMASVRLAQSLRSFARLIPTHLGGTKPYGFLYGAAQMSYTAGTLCDIGTQINCGGGIRAAAEWVNCIK
jgi:hypothetical protein